ncbi:hypothetical protein AOR13_338 [Alteromonas stellipolaris LMG 21856]|nr:hypothetical protein AOR13_338 [Alteromonas stellipolaris LMG 21856]
MKVACIPTGINVTFSTLPAPIYSRLEFWLEDWKNMILTS